MSLQRKKQKTSKKPLIATLSAAIIAVGGYSAYAVMNSSWPFTSSESPAGQTSSTQNTGSTSNNKSDVENIVNNGGNEQQGDRPTAGTGVVDTDGNHTTHTTEGVTSKSGNITLYSPVSGQKLSDGVTVSGVANVATVQYRMYDAISGQVGQGSLTVIDGKFSGTIRLVGTQSTTGTFEVYSFDSNGREINDVKVPVTYK